MSDTESSQCSEPNAALIMALSGQTTDTSEKLKKERNELLNSLGVINEAREREMRRIAGLERARARRSQKTTSKQGG